MVFIALICCVCALFGVFVGSKLAARGIRTDSTLEKCQGGILLGLIAIAGIIFSLVLIDRLNLIHWLPLIIPAFIQLYIAEYATDLILGSGCFILGLLLSVELLGKRSPKGMRQLFVAVAAIILPLTILLHYSLPVTGMIGEPRVIEGVVLQTTPYTCAPASIATLARFIGKHPHLSERDVATLTKTDRFGTSTLAEIRAMGKLGLEPKYKYGLKIEELAKTGQPALLHVREKFRGKFITHAVALLSVDTEKQFLTIGNPLSGIQVKTFKQMEGYWLGEAVFVNR